MYAASSARLILLHFITLIILGGGYKEVVGVSPKKRDNRQSSTQTYIEHIPNVKSVEKSLK
jgi:hypothetical protein